MKKLNTKAGFTLAELLIVVAIIAVLVAIAIPVFTTRLEASRETTDIANLRSAYASAQVTALSGLEEGTAIADDTDYYYDPNDGDGLVSTTSGGAILGQGSATNGKADISKLPTGCHYNRTDNVSGKRIAIQFKSGAVKSVQFENFSADES